MSLCVCDSVAALLDDSAQCDLIFEVLRLLDFVVAVLDDGWVCVFLFCVLQLFFSKHVLSTAVLYVAPRPSLHIISPL